MRAALYARFSSAELQNPKSIEDQLHECRRHAERLGATVVATFTDYGISAAAMGNRPGVLDLLAAARTRAFDVVIADELSRLTRDGGHAWDIFYELRDCGIAIESPTQGEADELKIGMLGTFGALERKQIGNRVRRSLAGVVREGRVPGRTTYGYRIKRVYDAKGEPIRGLREIDDAQAAIVRRIFAEYLGGSSPQAIARRLNADGVDGPAGGLWSGSGISGVPSRPTGTLRNPMYVGEIVWGRRTYSKDRRTGKTKGRPGDLKRVVSFAIPELAIIDRTTFDTVQAQLAAAGEKVRAAGNASAANRPKRLLSGLVRCGLCGGPMFTVGKQHGYRCWARVDQGPAPQGCDNPRTVPATVLETYVLDELRRDLLHPEVIESVIQEYRVAQRQKAKSGQGRRQTLEKELAEVVRRADRLLEMAPELISGPSVAGKLKELDRRRIKLEAELARERATSEVVALHPNAAERYRTLVADLRRHLDGNSSAERDAARESLRLVVSKVLVFPEPERGKYRIEVKGDLTGLIPMIAEARRRAR